jgi:hypothetical protein
VLPPISSVTTGIKYRAHAGIGFVPIDLRFHAPDIALRNAGFAHYQAQRNLPVVHILAHGPLCNLARGQLVSDPRPDAGPLD